MVMFKFSQHLSFGDISDVSVMGKFQFLGQYSFDDISVLVKAYDKQPTTVQYPRFFCLISFYWEIWRSAIGFGVLLVVRWSKIILRIFLRIIKSPI